MTKEEAREWFKTRMDSGLMPGTREAYKAALSALTPPNEPLTLDELRGMEGQPVWLETGEVIIKEQIIGCWEIVRKITRFANETVFWMTRREGGFGGSNYGKTWLAYRRPPEEET